MIEIKNLTKIYNTAKGKVIALNNINLKIEDGDIFGVIGLSGAGKSTLVRCINGLETFNEGEILYNGEKVKFSAEYRRKVAMIFQQFNLLQQRTVLKNVELAGEIVGDTKRREKAIKLLNAVGIGDKLNAYPSQLSGGQQQRVAIARALMSDPEVLLCDEATSALDPETTQSILELIKQLNKQLNITVVVISHQMSVIEQICNKVAIIDHSEIVESGYINDVFLSPKTAIGKKLVYSSHIFSTDKNEMLIKIKFDGGVNLPVVTNIIKELNVQISILYAETKELCGKVYGQTIFTLPDYKKDVGKVREYLTSNGIAFEELGSNELCQGGQEDSAPDKEDVKEVR